MTSDKGLLTFLSTPCHVSKYAPAEGSPERKLFHAMWDTGCSKSIITKRVVKACGLKPIRAIRSIFLSSVKGLEKSEGYVVNIHLPDKLTIRELTVFSKDPGDVWWDMLIGMDIISIGDFSVRNVNSKTEWTFSIPSQQYEGAE